MVGRRAPLAGDSVLLLTRSLTRLRCGADFRECWLEVGGRRVLRFASAYGFRNIQVRRRHCPLTCWGCYTALFFARPRTCVCVHCLLVVRSSAMQCMAGGPWAHRPPRAWHISIALQGLMRKIKLGRCEYDYVEIMACPSGECLARATLLGRPLQAVCASRWQTGCQQQQPVRRLGCTVVHGKGVVCAMIRACWPHSGHRFTILLPPCRLAQTQAASMVVGRCGRARARPHSS